MRSMLMSICAGLLLAPTALAEIPSLPPPTFSIPFDELDEADLQEEVSDQALAFLKTLQRHWGQSRSAFREALGGTVGLDEQDKFVVLRNLGDHGVLEGYEFRQEALVRGQYVLLQRPLNGLNEFIGYYSSLKGAVSGIYGTPVQDQILWDNDLYQPLPDYWGVAVMIGHLRYHATWETMDGTVSLELTGNRHCKLLLEYRARHPGAET